jgi:ribokinase
MRAVVVGSANTDLIMQVDALPQPGHTAVGGGFTSGPGGKGANQAVSLARLGAETALVARFGRDDFSALLRSHLEERGVDLSCAVRDSELHGGTVFIIVDATGNNTMILDLGSNMALDGKDVERASGLFDRADLLLLQLEVSDGANLQACRMARERGMRVVLNPAPQRQVDRRILEQVHLVTPNLHELSELLENLEGRSPVGPFEEDPARIGEAAGRLLAWGPELVVVTAGSRGSVAAGRKGWSSFGTFAVRQVDSTAASDAFTAGLALQYAGGGDIEECVRFASACAAITVSRHGAIPSLPDAGEVRRLLGESRMEVFGN